MPPPEHSLLPVEAAQALHVIILILDLGEDHRQLQGSWAHRLSRQKGLTGLLGCLLLSSQALEMLGCVLGQGWSGQRTQVRDL